MNAANPSRSFLRPTLIAGAIMIASFHGAFAAVSYSTIGSTYLQDFDTLPNAGTSATLGNSPIGWTDDNAAPGGGNFSILGWYLYHPLSLAEGGFNGRQRVRSGPGSSNVGSFWSFGTGTSTERALGAVASNTMGAAGADNYIGLRLSNDTGQTLYSFTLTYDGEQWRDGGAATPNAQSLVFMWSTTASAISDPNTSFVAAPALNFTSPVLANTGGGAGVDGNAAGKIAGITATIEGINWAPGTDLWLRWNDVNNSGNDHGLGIDNISLVAQVPEPASYALLGLGAAVLLIFRRRK